MIDSKTLALIKAVVDSADSHGCHEGTTLASQSTIEALADCIKQQECLASNGNDCPFCGNGMVDATGCMESDDSIVWQGCKCDNCGKTWDNEYHLVGCYEN